KDGTPARPVRRRLTGRQERRHIHPPDHRHGRHLPREVQQVANGATRQRQRQRSAFWFTHKVVVPDEPNTAVPHTAAMPTEIWRETIPVYALLGASNSISR